MKWERLPEKIAYRLSRRFFPEKRVTYAKWKKGHILTDKEKARQREVWSQRDRYAAPCFLVVLETDGQSEARTARSRQSLCRQTYLPDKVFLGAGAGMAKRLLRYLRENGGWERTWILRLAAGDTLEPDFFYRCAEAIRRDERISIWYCDHVSFSGAEKTGKEPDTCFKPDFSEDYLAAYPYIGPSWVAQAALYGDEMQRLDWDGYRLLLRWAGEGRPFGHIQRMLYARRQYDAADAPDRKAGQQAGTEQEEEILRLYQNGEPGLEKAWLVPGPGGTRQIRLSWKERPLISVLIPNKDHAKDLLVCLKSLQKQTVADRLEVLILENNSEDVRTFAFYEWLLTGQENVHLPSEWMDASLRETFGERLRVLYWEGEFHYSRINNFGAENAAGKFLLLLNNDIELIGADGIERMLEPCMLHRVGAVGAKLYYEDETIQHAGVVVGLGGVAGHAFVGLGMEESGYNRQADCLRRVSAVTAACLLVKADVYREAGGFCEELAVAFNDVDFCLKVCALGKQILYQPACQAWHFESKSRGQDTEGEKLLRFQQEIRTFQQTWADFLKKGDPYYNQNLTLDFNDYSYRDPRSGGRE